MKKKYNLRPCMTVVKMRNHQLLAGSPDPPVEGEGSDYEWGD
ncbi:hypothetical protein SAMN04487852_10460 [Prevotella sp. tf2-5]|jgi:hypothetical protein|nr:hypothetical protein SAMN04487852_10460 [Prevotella sp. tf2-5]